MRALSLLLACALCGCPRAVPEHLRVDGAPNQKPGGEIPITDVASALRVMIGRDPLARSPSLPDANQLDEIAGGAPLAAFVRQVRAAETGQGAMDRLLLQLEDEWPNTAAVALSRGYRLRLAENHLANKLASVEQSEAEIVALLTPLTRGISDPTLPRRPLEWLGVRLEGGTEGSEADPSAAVRRYAERWVLSGWLASPDLPLSVLVEPMNAPQYDNLSTSGEGALVLARASRASGDDTSGMDALRRATMLALQRAAADRDSEQAAFAEQLEAARQETGDKDPVGALLQRAATDLTAAAASERAAGGALLSLSALRWIDRCGTEPCTGVDRVETFGLAALWDPEVAKLAAIWRVVALKETIDSLDVGRETALFPDLAADLTDALLGTGAGPIEAPILRKQRPDAQTWLVIGRAVGSEGISDWEGARAALGGHLEREAERAVAKITGDEAYLPSKNFLDRISDRAIP